MTGIKEYFLLGAFPLIIAFLILALKNARKAFYVLFGLQFVIVLAGMFMDIKLSIATVGSMALAIVSILFLSTYENVDWKQSRNGMLWLYSIWAGYCILELANPNAVFEAWGIASINYFVFPLICAIFAPIALKNTKSVQWLLIIWSVFVLIAAFKGYWQKSHGFNSREMEFLYVYGGAKTHLIWSGIRYFSCFTDAANFGVHMALAITTFSISLFYVKNVWMKVYFGIVVAAAIYGMFISGTRSAIAIPLAGLLLFTILSGSRKMRILGLISLVGISSFFYATNIGNNNSYIRKMRSAFRPATDASYQVRVENRKHISELMASKPFGYGIGLSKGDRFNSKERMPYPPDSWLVAIWVETGIVGLVLYLLVNGVLFAWCSWLLMCKIMNQRLRGLLTAWICTCGGFFVAAYANDVMQYPNTIIIYTSFIVCLSGPYMDKQEKEQEALLEKRTKEQI